MLLEASVRHRCIMLSYVSLVVVILVSGAADAFTMSMRAAPKGPSLQRGDFLKQAAGASVAVVAGIAGSPSASRAASSELSGIECEQRSNFPFLSFSRA